MLPIIHRVGGLAQELSGNPDPYYFSKVLFASLLVSILYRIQKNLSRNQSLKFAAFIAG